jgi:hypothetical protein
MADKEIKNKEKKMPMIIPSDSPRIYANGAFGGYTPQDFRLMFFSEEPLQQDAILTEENISLKREVQAEIILAPLAAKQLLKWLSQKVEGFEKQFGKIPSPPEKKVE